MQYENIFKVIGGVHVILAFLVLLLLLKLLKLVGRRLLRVLVLGLLRWINVYSRTSSRDLFARKLLFQGVSGQNRGLKRN